MNVVLWLRLERKRKTIVFRFLKGLNEEFAAIKNVVLMIYPMPPVHRVFTMALKLEKQLKGSIVYQNDILHANAAVTETHNQDTVVAVNLGTSYDGRKRTGYN